MLQQPDRCRTQSILLCNWEQCNNRENINRHIRSEVAEWKKSVSTFFTPHGAPICQCCWMHSLPHLLENISPQGSPLLTPTNSIPKVTSPTPTILFREHIREYEDPNQTTQTTTTSTSNEPCPIFTDDMSTNNSTHASQPSLHNHSAASSDLLTMPMATDHPGKTMPKSSHKMSKA
jgi:hypothetical protein